MGTQYEILNVCLKGCKMLNKTQKRLEMELGTFDLLDPAKCF